MAMAASASVTAVSFSARGPSTTAAMTVRPRAAVSVRASASATAGGASRVRARGAAAQQGGAGKWWAPLVGWSGRADYIETAAAAVEEEEEEARIRSSSFVGGLTEAKARQLRARMVETESFHDAMYHSAIASRLARST
ncbi:uncharacterized protein LOC100844774 [Brachypodium distachyon]|uniref:Uncharacterized protein n=1 Tax=Brachypodium distachyon TaxID=15368 RepID=I1HLB2_BRADI|nr:uncharacterized protein LOC100844774 [Brachypodium distachyon]KQK07245.1 hypothetical protein BRADI_2g34140v3 [Brachypodium distachyon]|eukprot:XP_003568824.1 uncharacterized protein LOC100844774 [Brachypodium distachyon]